MIVFSNPGLIDIEAVRTMGVSVKNPGSFGFFGTGLKFAIATILRGGGSIEIYRGNDLIEISTQSRVIRGEPFDLIYLAGEPMGISTQLGKNWEPWMVLRELGCNAKDEGGDFFGMDESPAPASSAPSLSDCLADDHTVIAVRWAALDEAYQARGDLFLEIDGDPVLKTNHVEAYDRPSPYLYYRGVRVFKLAKPSRLTYNLISDQRLTEDRSLANHYLADIYIKAAIIAIDSRALAYSAITTGEGYHEFGLDFDGSDQASKAFLDAAFDAKEKGVRISDSVRRLILRHMREETQSYGGSYHKITSQPLEAAIEGMNEIGLDIDLEKNPVVIIAELPSAGMRSMSEAGRIYILDSVLREGPAAIAIELIKRLVDIRCPLGYASEAADLLAPLLIKCSDMLYRSARLAEEFASLDEIAGDDEALTEAEVQTPLT
jgi:hypothetical protein